MTPPTYAEARAACVARYGSPGTSQSGGEPSYSLDRWDVGDGAAVYLCRTRPGRVEITAARLYDLGVPMKAWTLAGPPTASAPAATLPAALDAADAFLRTHAHPTKGP